jgi:hypothetical protein
MRAALNGVRMLNLRKDRSFDALDRGLVALVESPSLDALAANNTGPYQNIQMFAGSGLAHRQLPGNQHSTNAVLDEITVHLRREVLAWTLQPSENLQPAIVG